MDTPIARDVAVAETGAVESRNSIRHVLHSFSAFTEALNATSAHAVLDLLEWQCRSLEKDLDEHRLQLTADAFSILCFRQFVRRAKRGEELAGFDPLPLEHFNFYLKTLRRLVEASVFPQSVITQFEEIFLPDGEE